MSDDTRTAERNALMTRIFELERDLASLKRELGTLPMDVAGSFDVLVFSVHDKNFAIRLTDVVEVLRMVKASQLPTAPPDIHGVINCRGSMLPVLNPGTFLSDRPLDVGLHTALIVVSVQGQRVAVMVDAVVGVEAVAASDFKQVTQQESAHHTLPGYVAGFLRQQDQHIALVDVEQLLSAEDQRVLLRALHEREQAETA